MKKLLGVLLALCMLFALSPLSAYAEEGDPRLGPLSYRITGGHAEITGCDMEAEGDLVVPEEIEGCPVTVIGDHAFDYCEKLRSIWLPDTVTSIQYNAFSCAFALEEVRMSPNLTHLGSFAFYGCESLKSITVPEGVKTLYRAAFMGCRALTEIRLPDGLRTIESEVFSYCSSLKQLTIPDSVDEIGNDLFGRCSSLETVHLPANLKVLPRMLFSDCVSLRTVDIPDSVYELEDDVFSGCSSLERVTLPPDILALSRGLFANCTSLTEVVLPDKITSIGSHCFAGCEKLTSFTVPDSVTYIGSDAFASCTALESVRLSAKMTWLDKYLFSGCTSLVEVYLPAGLQKICCGAFNGCTSLERLYYPGTGPEFASIDIEVEYNRDLEHVTVYLITDVPYNKYNLTDLPDPDNWAYPGIIFCLDRGLMKGVGGGLFQPDGITTRAQLVTILWRMSGEPEATKPLPFSDRGEAWANTAIAWASENGIVNGVGGGRFAPNDPITREQLVTIFHRFCKEYVMMDVSASQPLDAFPDAGSVSGWAKEAMEWAVAEKIISGVGTPSGPQLQPQGFATRAQIAKVILNFAENVLLAD